MEVSYKSWLVWSLALDDELVRALSGPGTFPKRKPSGVTELGFKENPRENAASLDPCRAAKQSLTTKFVPALSWAICRGGERQGLRPNKKPRLVSYRGFRGPGVGLHGG